MGKMVEVLVRAEYALPGLQGETEEKELDYERVYLMDELRDVFPLSSQLSFTVRFKPPAAYGLEVQEKSAEQEIL